MVGDAKTIGRVGERSAVGRQQERLNGAIFYIHSHKLIITHTFRFVPMDDGVLRSRPVWKLSCFYRDQNARFRSSDHLHQSRLRRRGRRRSTRPRPPMSARRWPQHGRHFVIRLGVRSGRITRAGILYEIGRRTAGRARTSGETPDGRQRLNHTKSALIWWTAPRALSRYYAAVCETLQGELTPSRGEYFSMAIAEPFGGGGGHQAMEFADNERGAESCACACRW